MHLSQQASLQASGVQNKPPRSRDVLKQLQTLSLTLSVTACGLTPHSWHVTARLLVACDLQDALLQETPMVYNKPDMLNPFFIVFGKRRLLAASPTSEASAAVSNGVLGK